MTVTVRPAAPEDVEALLRVKARSWREAYGGLLPAAHLDEMDAAVPDQVPGWTALIGSDRDLWVADDGGRLVGVAVAGPRRDRDGDLPGLELMVLYVLAETYGTGLGARLLDAVVGQRPACLRVLAENPRAVAFYAKHGFAPEGEPEPMTGPWEGLHEQLMVRRAGPTISRFPNEDGRGGSRFPNEGAPGGSRFPNEGVGA